MTDKNQKSYQTMACIPESRVPTLPMRISTEDSFLLGGVHSDSDSDFCPDWSSDSSFASSSMLALDIEGEKNDIGSSRISQHDREIQFVSKNSSQFMVVPDLPAPAAGKEEEGAATSSADEERESPVSRLK